jgi:hypothetical protein
MITITKKPGEKCEIAGDYNEYDPLNKVDGKRVKYDVKIGDTMPPTEVPGLVWRLRYNK